jgi:cholesterol transport system auxiliary component
MIRLSATLGLALALGGCVSFGGKPSATALLTITPSAHVAGGDARSAAAGEAITIAVPLVPQAIAVNRVAVSTGGTAIAYVKDGQWVEPPARLFQRLLAETVGAKTGRVVLDPRQFALVSGAQLNGQLRSFGIVVAAPGDSSGDAVIVFDAAYSRDQGKKVDTKRFEARVPVTQILPQSAGNALNRAANQIAADVADWVATKQ